MSTASIHPVLVTLVFLLVTFAITGIISFISTIITSAIGFTSALAADYETVALGGMLAMMPVTMILSLISFAVTCVLQTGYLAYTLKTIRHQESGLDELFRYFKQFVKLFSDCRQSSTRKHHFLVLLFCYFLLL